MKKFKENYLKFKELLSNPRKRAAIILSMYALFFLVLFTLVRIGRSLNNDVVNDEKISVSEFEMLKNYDFKLNIEQQLENFKSKFIITGNNNQIISVKKYNQESNEYEDADEMDMTINLDLIKFDKIVESTNSLEVEYSTEYKDGSKSKSYKVPVNLINEQYESDKTIDVTIFYKDDYITKIIINTIKDDGLHNNDIISSKYIIEFENNIIK